MKTTDIIGDNYFGKWSRERIACRGIIVKDGKILVSRLAENGVIMTPGGGLEGNESLEECCIREVAEETGYTVTALKLAAQINEYYEDVTYPSYYFTGEIAGVTARRLTSQETEFGLEPAWIPLTEALDIFSRHADYAETDEEIRGMYLREYTALCEVFGKK